MSVKNEKGLPFVILNSEGYFDLYDTCGNLVNLPKITIRVTQSVNEMDKVLIIGIVNVVKDIEEMQKIIQS